LRVLGFAVVLTGVAGFLFGVLPALRTARGDLHDALRSRPGEAATARSRLRSLLIGSQVTLSLVLLTGSGLLLRTLERSLAIDSGFDADRVLMLSVDFNANRFNYDAERGMAFYRQALERVRTLSGVESATWAADVPLVLVRRIIINFIPDNRPEVAESDWITADCDVVGPDHLKTLGIRLLAGRDFTQQDGLSTPEVAIVNETLARRYWPGENPVGKRFKVSGRTGVRQVEVVGLSRDVRQRSLHQEPRPFMYLHLYQRYFPEMTLYVRTSSDPAPYLAAVRRELSGIDPELPIFNARLMRDQLALALSRHKVAAALLSASSLVALVLSALGVYAVTSYGVARRRGEIGLRLALGAGEGSVLGLVVRDALRPAAVGLAAGIVACLAVTPLLKNLLWGVSEKDAASFGASAALLVAVVLLAAYLPARRALAVDPASSLRSE
jgi:predicted permease